MTPEFIRQLAKKVGSQGYKDGNSFPGFMYHPLPFPDLNFPHHKDAPLNEHLTMKPHFGTRGRVIDIGCNVGYHSFKLAMEGWDVTGVEADNLTLDVARAVSEYKEVPVRFIEGHVPFVLRDLDEDFDCFIFLNAHMWVYKQGPHYATETMEWLRKHCKHGFFQTAHRESGGMYQVPIDNERGLFEYLESFDFKVTKLKDTGEHGGIRIMFHLE